MLNIKKNLLVNRIRNFLIIVFQKELVKIVLEERQFLRKVEVINYFIII